MPDNLNIKGPEDPRKINVNQKHEIEYWTKKLKISVSELIDAVKAVGPIVKDVRGYLSQNKANRLIKKFDDILKSK